MPKSKTTAATIVAEHIASLTLSDLPTPEPLPLAIISLSDHRTADAAGECWRASRYVLQAWALQKRWIAELRNHGTADPVFHNRLCGGLLVAIATLRSRELFAADANVIPPELWAARWELCSETIDAITAAHNELESHVQATSRLAERLANYPAAVFPSEATTSEEPQRAGDQPPPIVLANPNDDRDKFIYDERLANRPLKFILAGVNNHSAWESLETESSVAKALKRYCKRQGLSVPKTSR